MASLYLISSDIDAGKGVSGEIEISFNSDVTYYSRKYTTLHFEAWNESRRAAVLFLMNESK